ncbi:hypothetical protein F5Y10DRAFT_238274 [Nemania abortiva]|nr:hypothetical protein F5Y10DRAFT_238274 [Nemania abortiva]
MVSTPPRTACDRSRDGTSRHDINESFTSTNTDESSDDDSEVQRAQETIEASYRCHPLLDDSTFRLNERSYEKLRQGLQVSGLLRYFDEEVRSDWNPETGKLTLRAATSCVHNVTNALLVDAIKKELDRVAEKHHDLRRDREKLGDGNCCSLSNAPTNRASSLHKSPDGQFYYDGVRGSPFIIEIAYSERKENLEAKICEYFRGIPSVCTILAIDIDYPTSQERLDRHHKRRATISLWTAERTDDNHTTVKCHRNEVFRQHRGRASPGQLAIPFKFFLPPGKRTNKPVQDEVLVFPYRSLAGMVKKAEDRQRLADRPSQHPPPKRLTLTFVDENDNVVKVDSGEPEAKRRRANPPPVRDSRKELSREPGRLTSNEGLVD